MMFHNLMESDGHNVSLI